jgi:hypothetical protein
MDGLYGIQSVTAVRSWWFLEQAATFIMPQRVGADAHCTGEFACPKITSCLFKSHLDKYQPRN